jgi:pimeloyl-ACP methyl ester carboxylesterase
MPTASSLFDKAFDRTGRVPRPSLRRLPREIWSGLFYRANPPDPAVLPPGNSHVVLVIPGFFTSDAFTRSLRKFLGRCGYRAFGWDGALNIGPTARSRAALRSRVAELAALEKGPVSVIGVSLGGLFARDLAYDTPTLVRQVITLASPATLPTATTLQPLFQLCVPLFDQMIDLDRLSQPLPVPCTSIYTRDDGLIAWQSCVVGDAVEVGGPHVVIGSNPTTLTVLAHRLAPAAAAAGASTASAPSRPSA